MEKDAASKKKRIKLFHTFDPNDNGYLSLAEVDRGVQDVLGLKELFDIKPVIIRAFNAAKRANNKIGGMFDGDLILPSDCGDRNVFPDGSNIAGQMDKLGGPDADAEWAFLHQPTARIGDSNEKPQIQTNQTSLFFEV